MLTPPACRRLLSALPAVALSAVLALVPARPAPAGDEKGKTPSAAETVARTAAALYDGVRTETLPNGLRVYLKPVPDSPVVTTMVAYKVGSSDEDLEFTGLSHYLEH